MNVCKCRTCKKPLTRDEYRILYVGSTHHEFCANCYLELPARLIMDSEELLLGYIRGHQVNKPTYNWAEEGF